MYNKVMQKSCTGSNNEICYLQTKKGDARFSSFFFFFWRGWGSILGPLPRSTPQTEEPFYHTPPPPKACIQMLIIQYFMYKYVAKLLRFPFHMFFFFNVYSERFTTTKIRFVRGRLMV